MQGKKFTCLIIIFFLSLQLFPGVRYAAANPHTDAADCRLEYTIVAMSQDCWETCITCHLPTQPIEPLDIYDAGDSDLCLNCHESKAPQATNNLLLRAVPTHGGNHLVQIFYAPEVSSTSLRFNPQGPLLFRDSNGLNPKVHCSSCHNSMGNSQNLLRISNQGSALCFSCHNI